MALIRTIAQLKQYGAPNTSMSMVSIAPYITLAEQKHIIPAIGEALYNRLDTAMGNTPAGANAAMIEKLQYAVGPFALYYFMGENELNIGDAGLTRTETDHAKSAYNGQILRTRKSLYSRAIASLDLAIAHLQANKSEFSEWTSSEQYTLYNSLLLRSGREFASYYPAVSYPQQFYAAASRVIKVVEDLYILPDIGETFTDLKAKRAANTTLSADEKVLTDTLGTAIAYLAVGRAITELQVRLDDNGISVLTNAIDSDQDETSKRAAASAAQVSSLQRQCDSIGKEYLDATIDYLNKKATAEVFPKWFEARQAAAATTSTTPDINTSLNGIYSM